MTYDPVDTNDDGVVDADVDNQSVSANQGTIAELAARMTGGGGDQTVSNSTATTLSTPLQVEFEDTNIVNADASSGIITVQDSGGYLCSGHITWARSADWSVQDKANLALNAAGSREAIDEEEHSGDNRRVTRTIPATMVNLSQNDDIKLIVEQITGGDETIDDTLISFTNFCVWRLRE